MAAYYFRRRTSPQSAPSSSQPADRTDDHDRLTDSNPFPADHSVYIFPNPSSIPTTPSNRSSRSSLISAPTDFDSSDSFSFWSDSPSPSSSHPTPSATPAVSLSTRPSISHYTDDEVEIDVDSWQWSYNSTSIVDDSDSDESWLLEDEVERLGTAGIDFTFVNRPACRTRRLQSPDSQPYWVVHPSRCSRTHSRHRTISTLSSSRGSSARPPAPHPRIHIPLLSFLSSLLSIDLDDPALRLLTHTDPGDAQSVLFPGHTIAQVAYSDKPLPHQRERDDGDSVDSDSFPSSSLDESEPHGLPKLLLASLSDQSAIALRSLRAGLAVCAAHSSEVALPISGPLWRVVGEVCARSSYAWKEVWGGGHGASDSVQQPQVA